MNGATTPTILAIVVQLGLGLTVFYANQRRKSDQAFLLLSLVIVAWLASLYLAFSAKNAAAAEFAIRQASATAVLYLAALNLLRVAIRQKQQSWPDLLRGCRIWLLLAAGMIVLCQTKIFLAGAEMPAQPGAGAPTAIYGPPILHVRTSAFLSEASRAMWIYFAYCAAAFVALIILYWRDLRNSSGEFYKYRNSGYCHYGSRNRDAQLAILPNFNSISRRMRAGHIQFKSIGDRGEDFGRPLKLDDVRTED